MTENTAYQFQKDIFYQFLLGKIDMSIISKLDKAYKSKGKAEPSAPGGKAPKGGFLSYVAKQEGFSSIKDAKNFISFVEAARVEDRTLSRFPPDIRDYLLKVIQD